MSEDGKEDSIKDQASTPIMNIAAQEDKQFQSIVEQFQAFALQNPKQGLHFDKLNPEQVDKVLETMQMNEANAYNYHCRRLDVVKEVNLANIRSKSTTHRTIRVVFVIGITVAFILTILILFLKESYFIPWLTFLAGIGSGVGVTKIPKLLIGEPAKQIATKEKIED